MELATQEGMVLDGAIQAVKSAWPWCLTLDFAIERAGRIVADRIIIIELGPLASLPEVEALIPPGADLARVDVFPSQRFDRMPADVRERYRAHYRAFLLWRAALGADVEPCGLIEGVHYVESEIALRVDRWAAFGVGEDE